MKNEVVSIVIELPVEEVYAFMSDPRNRLRYDPGLIEVRQTPEGPIGIGTRIVEVRPFMGKKAEMVTEIFELEANRVISYRTLAGDPTGAFGSYRFALAPEGTRLTLDFTVAPKGLVKLAVPFTTRRLRRDIESGLANIKALLERQNGAKELEV